MNTRWHFNYLEYKYIIHLFGEVGVTLIVIVEKCPKTPHCNDISKCNAMWMVGKYFGIRLQGLMGRGDDFPFYAHMPPEKFPIQWMEILTITFSSSSSRYWVVFSVHDDTIPFLELWTEPTEVASKPPQFMFPLAVCQHISPSLVPAGDHEWTFVVNFETVAIRFSCNSR